MLSAKLAQAKLLGLLCESNCSPITRDLWASSGDFLRSFKPTSIAKDVSSFYLLSDTMFLTIRTLEVASTTVKPKSLQPEN